MEFIIADKDKKELGYVDIDMDMDIGGTNDYKFSVSVKQWEDIYSQASCLYIPDTEYGGPVSRIKTSDQTVTITGDIWRKQLEQKIIEPPAGQAYRTVSGEANAVIRELVNTMFAGSFSVPEIDSGIQVSYQFERYVPLLSGISKMLEGCGAKLDIKLRQHQVGFTVELQALQIVDYSENLEYGSDNNIQFTTTEAQRGINHLICLGKGELADRLVVHLYADAEGNVSETQTFFGNDERTDIYQYGNAESRADLVKGGTSRLKELMNYQEMTMNISNIDADIGDIVGGRNYDTGFVMKAPVTKKIIKIEGGKVKTRYEVSSKVKASQPVGGGNTESGMEVITDAEIDEICVWEGR